MTSKERKCPKCGAEVRERSGKYGWFWGCVRYPNCKGVWQPPNETDKPAEEREQKVIKTPYGEVKYQ